jgi:hypothetical protein
MQSEKLVQEICRLMSSDVVLCTLINNTCTPYLAVIHMTAVHVVFRSCFLFAETNLTYGVLLSSIENIHVHILQ